MDFRASDSWQNITVLKNGPFQSSFTFCNIIIIVSWFVERTLALLLSCSTSWLRSWRRVDKFSRLSFSHLHCCILLLASCILQPFFYRCIFASHLQNFENYRETRCFLRKEICGVLEMRRDKSQFAHVLHTSPVLLLLHICQPSLKWWFWELSWNKVSSEKRDLRSFGNETRQIPICNHVSALLSKLKRNYCIKLWSSDFEWKSGIERISWWDEKIKFEVHSMIE